MGFPLKYQASRGIVFAWFIKYLAMQPPVPSLKACALFDRAPPSALKDMASYLV
jgi:hypothetical protein